MPSSDITHAQLFWAEEFKRKKLHLNTTKINIMKFYF